ncbi:MAG: hypothetical protein IKZ87_04585 [Actinomycetaceae bacterium]|nr:hypothetical protein [Actinomycetaceae bacterium]
MRNTQKPLEIAALASGSLAMTVRGDCFVVPIGTPRNDGYRHREHGEAMRGDLEIASSLASLLPRDDVGRAVDNFCTQKRHPIPY